MSDWMSYGVACLHPSLGSAVRADQQVLKPVPVPPQGREPGSRCNACGDMRATLALRGKKKPAT
jgi:hypothetical protein